MKILLNEKVVYVKSNITILQACKEGGIEIPRFCYHERLMIAGNCRMCLVEVEKSVKPLASCAMPIMDNMKVYTNTVMVKKAREGVMELLLVNHPLDCPICDQGGKCDLQDQAMVFGSDRGRFYEVKRSVIDKNCGVLVKTVMTRCIHCTRCVRFSSDIAGVGDFGITGRGNSMEVNTYISNIFISEISGNVIDLCPVGALTSKPYAFLGRSWELEGIESIDIFDGMGSNIRVMVRGNKLMGVLPIVNEELNEEWITDKCRFGYDGYNKQRLLFPMYNDNGFYREVSWEEAFSLFLLNIFGRDLIGVIGKNVSLETAYVFKYFFARLGNSNLNVENSGVMDNIDFFHNYAVGQVIDNINSCQFCLIIGGNLRLESPLLLVRLRKREKEGNVIIITIGVTTNYYLKTLKLGNSIRSVVSILEGRNYLCRLFLNNNKGLILFSTHGLSKFTVFGLKVGLRSILKYNQNINLEFLNLGANIVGLFDLGLYNKNYVLNNKNSSYGKVYYLLDSDDLNILKTKNDFVIYQGHHGDRSAVKADLIFPSKMNLEEEGLYVNMFGIVQKNNLVLNASGNIRGNWRIIKNLLDYIYINDHKLTKIGSLIDLRFVMFNEVPFVLNQRQLNSLSIEMFSKNYIFDAVFNNIYSSYYMSDSITRSSSVMAQASKKLLGYISNFQWN